LYTSPTTAEIDEEKLNSIVQVEGSAFDFASGAVC
jgi:hypothetical protein